MTFSDRVKDDYMANRQLRDVMRSKRRAAKSIDISNSGKNINNILETRTHACNKKAQVFCN